MIRRLLFGRTVKRTTKELLKEKLLTLGFAVAVYAGMHAYEQYQERRRTRKEEEAESVN